MVFSPTAIRAYREHARWTQESLARAMSTPKRTVSKQSICNWEAGRASPSVAHLWALAKTLDVDPEDLMEQEEE